MSTFGNSLADGAGMFWETLWALILGFTLSGAVQAFVSRAQMQRSLGDDRPRTIAKASFFGTVSSSCSYAAAALAKTLFARGANFTAAQAFMFASTNLVVELGIVLWLLIGWEFAAAEFVGGAIMIVLVRLVLPRVVSDGEATRVRDALNAPAAGHEGAHDHHGTPTEDSVPWRTRIRTLGGWADASAYTISDLTMLRRELVIGFVVAGFADTAVPIGFWKSLFITGHGFWSTLENVVLGPFLAIISFVCSIGNVPLAASLWSAGITFGGVVAFIFADLITLPLLIIYRNYYGTRLTLKLLAAYWATMSVAGLATEYLFKATRIAPNASTSGHGKVGRDVFGWNYTTVLDVIALVAFAALYWLYRNRERFGAGAGYAKDPVCGMQVETHHAPATSVVDSQRHYFCSDHCQHKFDTAPNRYAASAVETVHAQPAPHGANDATIDPVCGMTVAADDHRHDATLAATTYRFCSERCQHAFLGNPEAYLVSRRRG
ncbi:MAG TPA: permease [Mycobacteriales bacterium]|nr:permease [Mycobacteriales bacterium]